MAKLPFKVTADAKLINAYIASLEGRAKVWRQDAHIAACSVALHAIKHKDVTLATKLVNASFGDGAAVRTWLEANGPFVMGTRTVTDEATGKEKEVRAFVLDKTRIVQFQDEAKDEAALIERWNSEPYWNLKPDRPWDGFDFPKAFASLIRKAERHAKNHPDSDKLNLDGLAQAKALARALNGQSTDEGGEGGDDNGGVMEPEEGATHTASATVN